MFGFSPVTIAACTVAALAITTAIMPSGLKAQLGKDQTRVATVGTPVSLARPGVVDGCLIMTERKLRADGGYDVNKFRICE